MSRWKKLLPNLLLGLIFLVGLGIFTYPTVSDQWNRYHQSKAIASYEKQVEHTSQENFDDAWAEAKAYNETITENTFQGGSFSQEEINLRDTPYWQALNLGDNGLMGYLSVPKIDQKLPIYHGTSDGVLQIAAGHLMGTKLPIGGEGNHSVLAAHRGLPSAKLFSDLDQMEIGDKFYIHVLDQTLAYEVDQILPMVDKDDIEALTEDMKNIEGEDHVTLFTCTPYGVNSHRLLVRGVRTAYHGEDSEKVSDETMLESIQDYYMLYGLFAAAVLIMAVSFIQIFLRKRHSRREMSGEEEE